MTEIRKNTIVWICHLIKVKDDLKQILHITLSFITIDWLGLNQTLQIGLLELTMHSHMAQSNSANKHKIDENTKYKGKVVH